MAVGLARQDGAALLLLHALTPPSPFVPVGGKMPSSYLTLQAAARRDAHRRLAACLGRARAAGARARARLVEGGAAEEILKNVRRWRPDLVVIGTHGRSGVRRFLMGSIAEHVVRRASRPVLTVRSR
jgi:nucleotide-binding universal stress UspA family protein